MNKKVTVAVAVVLLVCFIVVYAISFLGVFSASAAPTKSEYKNQLNNVKTEKSQVLQNAQNKEVQISELEKEINTIQNDINVYSGKIAQTETELQAAEQKEQEQYEAMKLRLRTMYEDNNTTYVSLLFSGDSLSEVVSYIEIIKQMVGHDNNMHDALEKTRQEIADKKQSLEDEKAVLDAKKSDIQTKQNTLVSEKAQLDSMAAKLSAEESQLLKKISAIEAEERAMQQRIMAASTHSATSNYGGGKLGYPCPANITSPYGYRIHPIFGTRKLHTGVDFAAPTGTSIAAAADGKVILASSYGGYGNAVIIDHGGGLTTLYAHNSSLLVSVGQQVKRGQVIAKSGSTGNSTGPHCHFEVRINGATTNPMSYLK